MVECAIIIDTDRFNGQDWIGVNVHRENEHVAFQDTHRLDVVNPGKMGEMEKSEQSLNDVRPRPSPHPHRRRETRQPLTSGERLTAREAAVDKVNDDISGSETLFVEGRYKGQGERD
jgi:hypothetical protein